VESVARDTTGHEIPDAIPDICKAVHASLHPLFDTQWRWTQNKSWIEEAPDGDVLIDPWP